MWRLIDTSPAVSSLPAEGQFLPEVRAVMRDEPWDAEPPLPWPEIKEVWDRHWDHTKPVLVEKSPPNLIRVDEIRLHFAPVRFVVMVRDPYAHTEGLMRRNGWSAGFAAAFAVRTLRAQMDNARRLGTDAVTFTYEALVADPGAVVARLVGAVPALAGIDVDARFAVHSIDGDSPRGIVDLNARKVARLMPGDLRAITEILRANDDVMRYWGYGCVEPSRGQAAVAIRTRAADRGRSAYRRLRSRAGQLVRRLVR